MSASQPLSAKLQSSKKCGGGGAIHNEEIVFLVVLNYSLNCMFVVYNWSLEGSNIAIFFNPSFLQNSMETTNQQFVTYPEKWPKIQFLSQKIRL